MFFTFDYSRRIIGAFLFIVFFSFFPLLQAEGVQQDTAEAVTPKPGALQVLDAESLQMGKVLDREQRDFSFRLRNGQEKPLKLNRVRVNCPCLSLLEVPPAEFTLAPGDECQIKGRFDAGKLKVGSFNRVVLVEVEGEELQLVHITGESVQMLDFEPGPGIDLGTFAGVDVPWSRTIHIKSRFTGDQVLELLPPPPNENFEYHLEKISATEYRFEFKPKLPLPRGRLKHLLDIPTRGIERYGSVQVGLFGTVTGWRLTTDKRLLMIDLKKAQAGQAHACEVKIVQENRETMRGGRRRFTRVAREKKMAETLASVQLVSEEETAADSLNKLETWQKIAAAIRLNLPEGVTLEKVPQADGIMLKMTFPENYFLERPRLTVLVHYQKKTISRLNIVGRK
jgi:hypothetical protein